MASPSNGSNRLARFEPIRYEECYGFWPDGMTCGPYEGNLNLRVPADPANWMDERVIARLEYPDGSARIPGTQFWLVPLDAAMKNAHHDSVNCDDW